MNPVNSHKNRQFMTSHSDVLPDAPVKKEKKSKNKTSILYFIFGLVSVGAIAAAIFFYIQYTQLKPKVDNPSLAFDEQIKVVKENISKLILIENDETLSVASINDADKLRAENPEFYKNAKNGNYVLISSKRAILYDKDRNLILNVAPIINSETSPTVTPVPTVPVTPTVKK